MEKHDCRLPIADCRLKCRQPIAFVLINRQFRSAFSLVEVMISIALCLILMFGINIDLQSDDRYRRGWPGDQLDHTPHTCAVQSVMYNDMCVAVLAGSPCFIISGRRVTAFRNRADEQGDRDYDPGAGAAARELGDPALETSTVTTPRTPPVTFGEEVSPAIYNERRSHRIDRLAFFTRDLYRRQTGDAGNVRQHDVGHRGVGLVMGIFDSPTDPPPTFRPTRNTSSPESSSCADNPNNFDASQFLLGRMAVLLKDPSTITETSVLRVPPLAAAPECHEAAIHY